MGIKKTLKGNRYTYYLIRKGRRFQLEYLPYTKDVLAFNLKRVLRALRIYKYSTYGKLKGIKNKHEGKRCFIIATGPSLMVEDLEKLTGEFTFSMNSICLAFDKTNWRPTYYGIQDIGLYQRMKDLINGLDNEAKFFGDHLFEHYKFNVLKDDYIFPINFLHHSKPNNTDYHTKFSKNPSSVVYNGHTITYSLLQIAVYMGFKEIYLLGTDCNYGSDMNHHFINYDYIDPTYYRAKDMMTASYKEAKKYADKHQIKIYNATRGGMLEVFERVDLDHVLNKQAMKQSS